MENEIGKVRLRNEWTFWAANGNERLSKICDVTADTQQEAAIKLHEMTDNKFNDGDSWVCSFQNFDFN